MKNAFEIELNIKYCKSCGICIEFCPKRVFEYAENGKARAARPQDCIGCGQCELRCPDFAIRVGKERQNG